MNAHSYCTLVLLPLVFTGSWVARAGFEPITLTAGSYNQDLVVEKTAPPPAVPVTTASMSDGIASAGLTWFERGYVTEWPATGLPEAGSVLTSDQSAEHQYQLPFSYKTNNAVLIDSVRPTALVTFATPTNYAALSFLTSSGGGRNQIAYTVHYGNLGTETGTFVSPNWYNDGDPAWAANGCVNVSTFTRADLNSYNPRLYSVDVTLTNALGPVTSIELALASGTAHTAVFAVSGSFTVGGAFIPSVISGYNEDLVVEVTATKPGPLDTNTTATMDGGIANTKFTWYERGYHPLAPQSGLPEAGSILVSEMDPDHRFQMPSSYTQPNAVLLDTVCSNAIVTLLAPASYSALSFLTASSRGPVTNQCVVRHADGVFETNSLNAPDWFANSQAAFTAHGRVNVGTRLTIWGSQDGPCLYAVDVPIAHSTSPVVKILLSFADSDANAHAVIFAVSGTQSSPKPVQPVLTVTLTPDGQLAIHSTQSGRLQSCSSLPTAGGSWRDEGLISQSVTFQRSPGEPVRFYRLLAQ